LEVEVINYQNTEFAGRNKLKEKVAVVGSGIAGMGASYFLKDKYDLTIYEKNSYIGGHTNTVEVKENEKTIPIDTGFIVYNEVNYPNLIKLFDKLKVPVKNSNMSFSVQYVPTGLEFCGSGISGLFCQKRNFFNPVFLRLLYNINRFNQEAPKLLESDGFENLTLGEFIYKYNYHTDLLKYYLVPMSSAVWSTPIDKMMSFPIDTLVRFFHNHGFLGLNTQHQWKTVEGGSKSYVKILTDSFKDRFLLDAEVTSVRRVGGKVEVKSKKGIELYDKVILASHADESLKALDNPTELEKNILQHFQYEKNIATLHTDESIMPKVKSAWSSWNYRVEGQGEGWKSSNIIYWMNSLQGVSKNMNYFVSINDTGNLKKDKILKVIDYHHPLFNKESVLAQKELKSLNQQGDIFYCGSYFKYGFHEDAFTSGLQLAEQLLGQKIWN
jgi:uncharacterized protein